MGRHSPTSTSPGYTTMVNCNCKLAFASIFVLIGLCAAAEVKCPVRYEGNNPQKQKAYLDIDIGQDFFPNGWKLQLKFDKGVKEVEIPQTRREASQMLTPQVYRFQNRGYNSFLRGPSNSSHTNQTLKSGFTKENLYQDGIKADSSTLAISRCSSRIPFQERKARCLCQSRWLPTSMARKV